MSSCASAAGSGARAPPIRLLVHLPHPQLLTRRLSAARVWVGVGGMGDVGAWANRQQCYKRSYSTPAVHTTSDMRSLNTGSGTDSKIFVVFFSLFLSAIDFFFLSFTLYLPIFIFVFVLLVACVGVMCLCMSVCHSICPSICHVLDRYLTWYRRSCHKYQLVGTSQYVLSHKTWGRVRGGNSVYAMVGKRCRPTPVRKAKWWLWALAAHSQSDKTNT